MAVVDVEIESRISRAILAIKRILPVEAVYLFGSQLKGTATEWSDVDLAVFVTGLREVTLETEVEANFAGHNAGGFDLEFHFFDAADLENAEASSFATEAQRTGVKVA